MIYQYDATEESCPIPLVQLRLILKKMHEGDECIFTLKDVGSRQDIPKLLLRQGYQFSEEIDANIVKIIIKT